MSLKFNNEISVGNLISSVVLIVGMVASFVMLQADQRAQAAKLSEFDGAVRGIEVRVRAAELALAGQSSDLRNIQIGIGRIEAAVERLSRDSRAPGR